MKFGTKVIHAGIEPDLTTGAVMTPIYQTTTYAQDLPGNHKGFAYSRTQNPTRTVLQNNLAALENGKYGICFSSGMAAISAILQMLQPGDEIISTNDLYGGSYRLFKGIFEKFGIKTHYVDMSEMDNVTEKINLRTKLIWIETPTNPMLNMVDISSVCTIAQSHEIITCVDNTFATPYLQRPLELGADIVMHSATKYLGGHSDVIHGALILNNDLLAKELYYIQNAVGAIPSPQDCFLILRGVKTLHLRVQRSCENAILIADFLKNHKKVAKVNFPGLTNHRGHELALRQMSGFGGMISFSLVNDTKDAAFSVMKNTKYFTLAESLGGVESLIGHPVTMTHASIPEAERLKSGITDSLIRLSIGVEDVEDLIKDLDNALI